MTHSSFQNINEERWRKSITCQSRRHKVWWGGWKPESESRAANEGERNTKRRVWVCESSCEKRERPGVKMRERLCWRREKEGEFHWKRSTIMTPTRYGEHLEGCRAHKCICYTINKSMLLFKDILKIHVYSCNDVVVNKTGSCILHIFNIFENRVIISYCCNSNKTIKNGWNNGWRLTF